MKANTLIALAATAVLAAGCDGSSIEGIHVEVIATGKNGVAPVAVSAADGTTVQTPATPKDAIVYRSADGMKVEVEFAALNLEVLSVNACPSVAAWLRRGAAALLSSAYAHGSAVDVEPGGVAMLDGAVDLGRFDLAPGRYCSLTVSIAPDAAPAPDYAALAAAAVPPVALRDVVMTDLSGAGAGVSACFYFPSQGKARQAAFDEPVHTCLGNLRLITEPVTFDLPFAPVELDAASRRVTTSIAIRYDRWFDDIPMDLAGEPPGAGGMIQRFSSENPNPLRPFPDKDVVPGTDPKVRCSVTPECAAEFELLVERLVANITDPVNFELEVRLD